MNLKQHKRAEQREHAEINARVQTLRTLSANSFSVSARRLSPALSAASVNGRHHALGGAAPLGPLLGALLLDGTKGAALTKAAATFSPRVARCGSVGLLVLLLLLLLLLWLGAVGGPAGGAAAAPAVHSKQSVNIHIRQTSVTHQPTNAYISCNASQDTTFRKY